MTNTSPRPIEEGMKALILLGRYLFYQWKGSLDYEACGSPRALAWVLQIALRPRLSLPGARLYPVWAIVSIWTARSSPTSPDTRLCENVVLLAEDTDLLIAECAHLPGEQNPEWPHLNPPRMPQPSLQGGRGYDRRLWENCGGSG